ncbi:SAM-dependent methyltransferase [Pedobacter sp. UYP30]|uniref:methyltransferase domain-containing protein n=1 Tax=Pedobacter sp. UYP30 TaxID=1756400 RepID=UPI0033946F60
MAINTKVRSKDEEIMDDFALEGEELRDALDKIASINQFLGGNKVTLAGVEKLVGKNNKQPIKIIDVGCGNGDMLRALANYAKKKNLDFELVGIDANSFTVAHAESLSKDFKNISYQCKDVFNHLENPISCDIVLLTLTLHHFVDEDIVKLLAYYKGSARMGLVVNDLQRSATAYRLFTALCYVFALNRMSKQDGLTSILRGFKREDLQRYSKKLQLKKITINWKWAFRYQWIINTAKV